MKFSIGDCTKLCVIIGTRPEMIKMAPVIGELKRKNSNFTLVNTGQHYDFLLSKKILTDLKFVNPHITLSVGSGTQAQQTASAMTLIENILRNDSFDAVTAEGDTNTILAAALASIKQHIPFIHVEAGLRSFDRNMPEEINRIMADHCSELLFAPTKTSRDNLLKENIPKEKIFVVGNTIVDAVHSIEKKLGESKTLNSLDLDERNFILMTLHRAENVDNKVNAESVLRILKTLKEYKIVFPIHPRTEQKFMEFGLLNELKEMKNIVLTDPLGYIDFVSLLKNSKLVMTDSGGIQEESCVLKTPCLTMRYNTERPESVEAGNNILVGLDPKRTKFYVDKIFSHPTFEKKMRNFKNPFGDGKSAKKIVEITSNEISKGHLKITSSNFLK